MTKCILCLFSQVIFPVKLTLDVKYLFSYWNPMLEGVAKLQADNE